MFSNFNGNSQKTFNTLKTSHTDQLLDILHHGTSGNIRSNSIGGTGINIMAYSNNATEIRWTDLMSMYQLPDKKSLFNTFDAAVFGFIFFKNSLLALNPNIVRLQEKLDSLSEEEEEELVLTQYFTPFRSDIETNIWHGYGDTMKFTMFRDVVTLQLNRVYEHFLLPSVSIKTSKALIKDMAKSAIRKHKRYGYSFDFGIKMFWSSLRSQILFYTAMFSFNCGYEIFKIYASKEAKQKSSLEKQNEAGIIIGYQFIQCGKGWFFTGIGGVIGSFISPGIGTLLGINLMPIIGVLFIDELLKPKVKVE